MRASPDSLMEQYRALIEVSKAIASHKNLPELFHESIRSLDRLLSFDLLAVTLYEPALDAMRLYLLSPATALGGLKTGAVYPVEELPGGWVWKTQAALTIGDMTQETRFPRVMKPLCELGLRSLSAVPLTTPHRRLGAMSISSRDLDAYSPDLVAFQQLLADQIAVAVDNALSHQELQRSEAYLAEGQRLSHTGSWAHNIATGEMFWSQEVFRIHGLDPSKVKPSRQVFLDQVHPEDRPIFDRSYQAVHEHRDHQLNHRIVLPDGTIRHVQCVGHPVVSESGELIEVIGTVVDVTEQHQARATLEKALEEIQALKDRLYKENLALREEIDRESMFEEIVGASRSLQGVLSRVAKVAPTDSTVLINGETGVGKELIARAIHKCSPRAGRAFVSVDCAALPPSLISSELFGHERGAFTGAQRRRLGRFELAEGGTVFLDEVGELPPETQLALLRVLQERQIERVGSSQPISVDVRVIAATNRDLQAAIAAGTFRKDLFYRLNVFPIEVPPLRERGEDILILAEYFIGRYASKVGKKIRNISEKSIELFQTYPWPGNIRELQNVIERAVILCEGETLAVDESWLPVEPRPLNNASSSLAERLAQQEKEIIEAALAESRGRVAGPSGAAAKLGLPPSTLESKIKTLKIKKSRFRAD